MSEPIEKLPKDGDEWIRLMGKRENYTSGRTPADFTVEKINEIIDRLNELPECRCPTWNGIP